MTIFEFLNIPDTYPMYFMDNRFYAYKDLLLDLHNNIEIKLKKPTKNNTILQQLNIPFIVDDVEYLIDIDKNGITHITIKSGDDIHVVLNKILYTLTFNIKQLNFTVHYNQDVNSTWFIAHTSPDKPYDILYYKNDKGLVEDNNISRHIQNMVNNKLNT